MSHLTIEPGSPAMEWLQLRVGIDARTIRINPTPNGLQLKWGEGVWTTPLSTKAPDADVREFHPAACGHPVCNRCDGHKDYRETNEEHETEVNSCYCCKHCGRRGGHE